MYVKHTHTHTYIHIVSERGFMSEQSKRFIYGREKHRNRRNKRVE